jgi:uncharacterized protein YdeI (YjbR/CyaY-like superfamily)
MAAKPIKTLDVRSRAQWRAWLAKHHTERGGVWLVFHKRHTNEPSVDYDQAVEEALCFGWIDSLVRRLDDERYARKFTPRRADSRWSELNRRRYAALEARGSLSEAGRANAPSDKRSYTLPQRLSLDARPPNRTEVACRPRSGA